MLFSSAIFAYTLTKIGEIIMDMNKDLEVFKREMNLINRYLEKKNISLQLRTEAINFVQYKFKNESALSQDEENYIIKNFSDNLRGKLVLNANIQIIENIKLFEKYTQETKEKIAMALKEITL